MEGRAFILGRNGLYNKIIEFLKKNNIYKIFFVFLFKNENEEKMKITIENLFKKGDQKELELFKLNNQIFYINEEILSEKYIKKLNFYLGNLLFSNFLSLKNFKKFIKKNKEGNYVYNENIINNNNNNNNNNKSEKYFFIKNFIEKYQKEKKEFYFVENSGLFFLEEKKYNMDNNNNNNNNNNYDDKNKNENENENEINKNIINNLRNISKDNILNNKNTKSTCEIL
jgi:hypothetical protein